MGLDLIGLLLGLLRIVMLVLCIVNGGLVVFIIELIFDFFWVGGISWLKFVKFVVVVIVDGFCDVEGDVWFEGVVVERGVIGVLIILFLFEELLLLMFFDRFFDVVLIGLGWDVEFFWVFCLFWVLFVVVVLWCFGLFWDDLVKSVVLFVIIWFSCFIFFMVSFIFFLVLLSFFLCVKDFLCFVCLWLKEFLLFLVSLMLFMLLLIFVNVILGLVCIFMLIVWLRFGLLVFRR